MLDSLAEQSAGADDEKRAVFRKSPADAINGGTVQLNGRSEFQFQDGQLFKITDYR